MTPAGDMGPVVHVVGAGLAGLAAATRLAAAGRRVVVHEAAGSAGGRCRSYDEPALGLRIDNGNHLVLSGNRAVHAYLARIGAAGTLVGPDEAEFAFADLADGRRWRIRPNAGRVPWWILRRDRRVPEAGALAHLGLARLLFAGPGTTVAAALPRRDALYERLWRPFLLAALNTEPEAASAHLAAAVLRETLAAGGAACRPLVAARGLSEAFVDPALGFLHAHGAAVRFGARLRALSFEGERATGLRFGDAEIVLGPTDLVVLAVPPWAATELVPGLAAPDEHRAIVNAHYRIAPPTGVPPLTGVVAGMVEWVFAFADRLSVTISAADRLLDVDRETLARDLWREVAVVCGLPADPLPRWQIVKERRATFAATPAQEARRPPAATRWRNLSLAGDWTATGLPATIEGAIRSGERAAEILGG